MAGWAQASTRAITAKLFRYIFKTLRGHMDEDLCRTIYPELLKRCVCVDACRSACSTDTANAPLN